MGPLAKFFIWLDYWFEYLLGVDDKSSLGFWEHMFRHLTFLLCVNVVAAAFILMIAIFISALGYDKPPPKLIEYDYAWFAPMLATAWVISISLNRKIWKMIKAH